MSRLGKYPIILPAGAKVSCTNGFIRAEGPKGKLGFQMPAGVDIVLESTKVSITRKSDSAADRAQHGLTRTLVNNLVVGVTTGYERRLEIKGVGYRAAVKGKILNLTLGFSHPVDFNIPDLITVKVEGNTQLILQSPDKALLGETCAKIRSLRPPEPYQGKGIKYSDEIVRRKAGKAAGSGK